MRVQLPILPLFCAVLMTAQPQLSQSRYKVSGTVVNLVTGQPIPRALVTLNGPAHQTAFTSDDGHFEFPSVPQGQAYLGTRRPGYEPEQAANRGPQFVAVNADVSGVTLRMLPGSAVHGRVVNENGEPVEGVPVQLLRRSLINGWRSWQQMNMAATDDTGSFNFESVNVGAYLIRTQVHPVFQFFSDLVVDGRHLPETYPPVYYPGSPDRASAQTLVVQPGSEVVADITVKAVPGFKISGTFRSDSNAGARCENADGDQLSRSWRRNAKTGEFTLSGVPPGTCRLIVSAFHPDGRSSSYSEQLVNIGAADVSGLQVSLQPMPEIPIVVSGEQAGSGQQVSVQLQNLAGDQMRSGPFAGTGAGGDNQSLAIRNPRPGTYRVTAQPMGPGCITAMQSGSVDLMHEPLTISADTPASPVNVTLSSSCASVTVKAEGASPSYLTSIILVGGAWGARQFMTGGGDLMTLANLAPGDYNLYAFADASDLEYANPEVMKNYSAQHITVSASDKPSVQLKVQDARTGTQ